MLSPVQKIFTLIKWNFYCLNQRTKHMFFFTVLLRQKNILHCTIFKNHHIITSWFLRPHQRFLKWENFSPQPTLRKKLMLKLMISVDWDDTRHDRLKKLYSILYCFTSLSEWCLLLFKQVKNEHNPSLILSLNFNQKFITIVLLVSCLAWAARCIGFKWFWKMTIFQKKGWKELSVSTYSHSMASKPVYFTSKTVCYFLLIVRSIIWNFNSILLKLLNISPT